jgi:hypothetical protein
MPKLNVTKLNQAIEEIRLDPDMTAAQRLTVLRIAELTIRSAHVAAKGAGPVQAGPKGPISIVLSPDPTILPPPQLTTLRCPHCRNEIEVTIHKP